MKKQKEIVKLREKILLNGDISLYLDIYYKGKRNYEFLNLHLNGKPKNASERQQNNDIEQQALLIRETRENEILAQIEQSQHKASTDDFLEYFKFLTEERKAQKGNYDNWMSTFKHLKSFTKGSLSFAEIDLKFLENFKSYLLKQVSQNSANSYFNKVKAALNQAFSDKLLDQNPAQKVESIPAAEAHREYLTIEELQQLAKTESAHPELKKAFLFSALTGLKWKEISKLKWSDLQKNSDGFWTVLIEKSGKKNEVIPVSNQALEFLGEAQNGENQIFNLKYSARTNILLGRWLLKAGINKAITFNDARHTFATLALQSGVDLSIVQKILGHTDIKTTAVYQKLIEEKKQVAVNNFPKLDL